MWLSQALSEGLEHTAHLVSMACQKKICVNLKHTQLPYTEKVLKPPACNIKSVIVLLVLAITMPLYLNLLKNIDPEFWHR